MMPMYDYAHIIHIDMRISITVDVWTISYFKLGCFVIIEIYIYIFGCRPISFSLKGLGIRFTDYGYDMVIGSII